MERKNMSKNILMILLSLFLVVSSFAQAPPPAPAPAAGAPPEEKAKSTNGPRKQLATIIFAGLGGAVLGLSTLSFYGRPQDNLSNIAIGFALGVITGTVIVTYRAATNPAEFYGTQYRPDDSFEKSIYFAKAQPLTPLKLNYTLSF